VHSRLSRTRSIGGDGFTRRYDANVAAKKWLAKPPTFIVNEKVRVEGKKKSKRRA